MSKILLATARITLGLFLLLAPVGCTKTVEMGSVSGTVTYGGKKIDTGSINFTPDDGKSPSVGSPIKAGAYEVPQILPGKMRVNVQAFKQVSQGTPEQILPPNAVGNGQVVEVTKGSQVLNFDLKAPRH